MHVFTALLLVGPAALLAAAPAPANEPHPSEPAPPAEDEAPAARFLFDRTALEVGATRVLPFALDGPAVRDERFELSVEPEGRVAVLVQPTVLAGESLGWMRVRGLESGDAQLAIAGSRLDVELEEEGPRAEINRPSVRISAPVTGAKVWGTFDVGVEVWPGRATALGPPELLLPDGSRLRGVPVVGAEGGPLACYRFTLDADRLGPGVVALGVEVAADGRGVRGEPLTLDVLETAPLAWALECEESLEGRRPGTRGGDPPRAASSPEASGGGAALLDSPNATWFAEFELERSGAYQIMLTARGSYAAGAFPSIGVYLDAPDSHRTAVRLVDRSWQRLPVGLPISLEAGKHLLGLRSINSGYDAALGRRVLLDRVELVRVSGAEAGEGGMGMMSMMAMGLASMSEERSAGASSRGGLWVAFEAPLDGALVNGRLPVRGFCTWAEADPDARTVPTIDLLVDGEVVASQEAARPVFALDRAALVGGERLLQLRARLPDGREARTPPQRVRVPGEPGRGLAPRDWQRFSVLSKAWDAGMEALLEDEGADPGHRVARLEGGAELGLALPDALEGSYEMLLEARGPDRPAPLAIELVQAGERIHLEPASVRGWWSFQPAGSVDLEAGPKRLELTREGGADAAPVHLRSLALRAVRSAPDRTPPRARILYPPEGARLHGVDAVVVEAWDDERLAAVDVSIDGRPQGTHGFLPGGTGHLVLPLLLGALEPGPHRLEVHVRDEAGNLGESRSLGVELVAEPIQGAYQRAVRLLDRLAFGPEPRALGEILVQGEGEWLRSQLAAPGPGDEAALGAGLARVGARELYQVRRAVSTHLLLTPNPVRARFGLWAQNHFSTWWQKARPSMEWKEYLATHALGPGAFAELLFASATSPAMLVYLDQARSYAGMPNENYAREVMELHSLGADGGYGQADVGALASLLTGLTVVDQAHETGAGRYLSRGFGYDAGLADGGEQRLLGYHFANARPSERFDRSRQALELLAAHPQTARFVSRSLVEHYVASPAPEDLVEHLAGVFAAEGGDFAAMLLALAEHPAFYAAPPRVASPQDFGLRLLRATVAPEGHWAMNGYLERSGMALFDRVTPDGYPEEDDAWVDTNAMLQRWDFVAEVQWAVNRLIPEPAFRQGAGDPGAWRQRVIDLAAVRLTGQRLGEASNRAALEYVARLDGDSWQRLQQTALFVSRTPEASLR